MTKIRIGERFVGDDERVFIIAEAGSNHDKNLNQAKKLVDIAVDSGCDAVKFQVFSADTLYSVYTPKLSELEGRSDVSESVYDVIKKLEMPREWISKLANYCKFKGIMFLSTPFDEVAVDQLNPFIPAFKVASYDIFNIPLLKKIAKKNKPIILSTGTAFLEEVQEAVEAIYKEGNKDVLLLHCISQYPAKFSDLNLRAIQTLHKKLNVPVGFSDHTIGVESSIAAVALGACVIEKHFTISRNLVGPDHPFSLEPNELKAFVNGIRNIEKALGDGIKKPTQSEEENRKLANRSIHAKLDIEEGSIITGDMLIMKRPALGILPKYIDDVIGKKARKKIKKDQWITWDYI